MTHLRLYYVCALLGAACTGEPEGSADPDPSEPGQPDPATLDDCLEPDMNVLPWTGAHFHPETFELVQPLPDTYLVATTAGWTGETEEDEEILGEYSNLVVGDLFTRAGLIGATLGSSELCFSGRTLTMWTDEESLLEFVTGEAHSEAITQALSHTRAWETTHWTETSAEPPTWEIARAKLEAARE
jgi:hypothetical protein